MIVSDLIRKLEEQLKEHGDLQVRIYADHGQECMSADCVSLQYIDEDSCMPEVVAEEDLDEQDEYIKVIEIS